MIRTRLRRPMVPPMLAAVVALGCCAASDGADRPPADRRHVPLEGQPNFRDVGGYRTADGKSVKRGLVYRSGELPRLTDADVEKLAALGLKTVVNFLTAEEIEASGPDRLPKGVKQIAQPIPVGDDLAKVTLEARQSADFSKLPPEISAEAHRVLTTGARNEYAALLRAIIQPENQPLMFHCSHGIHRTGTATAILLWGLGVPWETVRHDYLLSNKYRKAEVKKRLAQLRKRVAEKQEIPPAEVDMTNIKAFYILQGDYIDATRDAILKEYGSVSTYLTRGLGLTPREVQQLRAQLLESM